MKRFFVLMALATIAFGCTDTAGVEDMQSQIDELKNTQIATLSQQVESINASMRSLEAVHAGLQSYITTLQGRAKDLEDANETLTIRIEEMQNVILASESTEMQALLDALNAYKSTADASLASVNASIESMHTKFENLQGQIIALKNYVQLDLKDYIDKGDKDVRDWMAATYATLEQYQGLVTSIEGLRADITSINTSLFDIEAQINGKLAQDIAIAVLEVDETIGQKVTEITSAYSQAISVARQEISEAYTTAIRAAIASSEATMQEWVNAKLTGYYTIAQMNAKLSALETSLAEGDTSNAQEIATLRTALAQARTELTAAYEQAIATAITQYDGQVRQKLAEDIDAANDRLLTLESRLSALEATIASLQADLNAVLGMIQSIVVVPDYSDGSVRMTTSENNKIRFEIYPLSAAQALAQKELTAFSFDYVETVTKSGELKGMTVTAVAFDGEFLVVTVDGSSAPESIKNGSRTANARLCISDGKTSCSSGFFQVTYTVDLYEIHYKTSDGKLIVLNDYTGVVDHYVDKANSRNVLKVRMEYSALLPYFRGASKVTSVVIPEGIKILAPYTFENCSGLTSITIPSSVTSIGNGAFSDCGGLSSMTIPEGVTDIGESAFSGCSRLTRVTIPSSVTSIGNYAFNGCSGLTVTFNNDVTNLGYPAFLGCSGVTVIFTNVVTSIGSSAFARCTGLKSVTIPSSVTSIGKYAFTGCSGLTSVSIPSSVTDIGDYAFADCTGLTSVTIPSSVTSIGIGTFSGCTGLTSVTIPSSVTSIGSSAFSSCRGLTSVTIPSSVTSIGSSAFSGCSGLTSVTIPEGVTIIEVRAFYGCSGLTSVTIPSSVTNIQTSAFSGCTKLTNVTVLALTPPSAGANMFKNNGSGRKIYVPSDSVDAYKAAEIWAVYASSIYSL